MEILIWEARNLKGISLERLAEDSGVAKSTINDYENKRTDPKMKNMEKIAKALGVKISDLYNSEYK